MTWNLYAPDGTLHATGATPRAALALLLPTHVKPSRTTAWAAHQADGWRLERNAPRRSPTRVPDVPAAVLAAAVDEARAVGFQWMRRADIAARAGVSTGLVSSAFGDMLGLKRAVLTEAVRIEDAAIVAQGLADGHPIAKGAPQALKDRAAELLTA